MSHKDNRWKIEKIGKEAGRTEQDSATYIYYNYRRRMRVGELCC